MDIALVQFDIAWEDKDQNFLTVRSLLSSSPPSPGSLIVLPEMFATGFSMNAGSIAEPYGGETEHFLSDLAREFEVFVVGGVAKRTPKGAARNKALAFSPAGELIGYYSKMRPFSTGGEQEHYEAGTRTGMFSWGECKVALFICYDLRFPELFRQAAAGARPELFVVIANWPEKRIHHWDRLLRARAIENQAYVAGVNRVGSDPYYQYNGGSLVLDAQGDTLAEGKEAAGVVHARLDIPMLRRYREGLRFLDDLKLS